MKRRWLVLVDDATTDEQNKLTQYLRERSWGFWHYFSDAWLIAADDAKLSSLALRDQVVKLLPGKTVLVLFVAEGKTWAAFGPVKTFDWVRSNWETD
jgi:hypothetical protein